MPPCRVRSDNTLITRFLLPAVLACFTIAVSAQQSPFPVFAHVDSAEVWFDQIVGPENAAIVNGPEYYISFKGHKTHPFYQSPESDRSFVRYGNDLYKNIDLLYDTYLDLLILKCVTSNAVYYIKLDNNLVQSFDLHGHHFKKYNEGIIARIGTYFDVLFEENQFAILVKRSKLERLKGSTRYYFEDDVYYILNSGKWIRITGKDSFAKTLHKDQRRELDAFIKSNHINVRKLKNEDLKKLGTFCYSLKERK